MLLRKISEYLDKIFFKVILWASFFRIGSVSHLLFSLSFPLLLVTLISG